MPRATFKVQNSGGNFDQFVRDVVTSATKQAVEFETRIARILALYPITPEYLHQLIDDADGDVNFVSGVLALRYAMAPSKNSEPEKKECTPGGPDLDFWPRAEAMGVEVRLVPGEYRPLTEARLFEIVHGLTIRHLSLLPRHRIDTIRAWARQCVTEYVERDGRHGDEYTYGYRGPSGTKEILLQMRSFCRQEADGESA